jgi:AcrR family transcriptional regulator
MATGIDPSGRMAAADRRAELMRCAGRLFGERGYSGTRIDDIAAAGQVTKPVVYRHFASKKDLYLSLLHKHEADLPRFFEAVAGAPADLPPGELLEAILSVWFDYVRENRHAWLMLFRDSSGDDEIREVRSAVSVRAREVIARFLAEAGTLPPPQIAPTAELLTSGLAGLALWWIDHPDVEKRLMVEVAVRMSTPALAPAAAAPH